MSACIKTELSSDSLMKQIPLAFNLVLLLAYLLVPLVSMAAVPDGDINIDGEVDVVDVLAASDAGHALLERGCHRNAARWQASAKGTAVTGLWSEGGRRCRSPLIQR